MTQLQAYLHHLKMSGENTQAFALEEIERRLSALETLSATSETLPTDKLLAAAENKIAALEAALSCRKSENDALNAILQCSNAQLTAYSDRTTAAEKELKLLRSLHFLTADEFEIMDKDAELGRLVRAMPDGCFLRKFDAGNPDLQWMVGFQQTDSRYYKPTPEEALRAAGVKVEEKCNLKDGVCRGGDCAELPDCKSLHTRKDIVEIIREPLASVREEVGS